MLTVINRHTVTLLYWATALTTGAFFLAVVAGVVARYILKSPILGAVEGSRLLFVWACFLAAALTYHRQAHIAITFLTDRFSEEMQRWIHAGVHMLSWMFFMLLFVVSIRVTEALWVSELPMLGISQGWFYVPLPFVCLFMASFAFEFFLRNWEKQ